MPAATSFLRLNLSCPNSLAPGLRRLGLAAVLALGMLAAPALTGGAAQAAVATPALGAAPTLAPVTETVRWVCGPWRCAWRPNFRYWYVPPYARAWGPPVAPGCFWRRNGWNNWVHICP